MNALYIKGKVYTQLEQQEKAIALWQQVLSINPDFEPAQMDLFEEGAGPDPEATPSSQTLELQRMGAMAKARMRKPQLYRNGDVSLTLDPGVGFVLEDAGNVHNGTVYAGGPFAVARLEPTDVHHLIGVLKLLVRQANHDNCRDMAILAYYSDESLFNYLLKMTADGLQGEGHGRFFVHAVAHALESSR